MRKISRNIKFQYPGSWLFLKKNIQWLFKKEFYNQLPFLIKLFSLYSFLYFKITQNDYLIGGRKIFLIITRFLKYFKIEYRIININNYKVCLDLIDPRFLKVVSEISGNDELNCALKKLLNPGGTFIDIGANHGSYSILANKYLGETGLVIAIEAQPRKTYAIEKSFHENMSCKYYIFNTAVGNEEGYKTFFIPKDTSGSAGVFSSFSARYNYNKIKVPVSKFDNLVDFNIFSSNTVIKVDIEGSEFSFLQGSKRFIKAICPILILEINPEALNASGKTGEELMQLLFELGYIYFSYLKLPLEKKKIQKLDFQNFCNVIFYTN